MARKKIEVVERKLGREKADGQAWIQDNKIEIEERLGAKEKFSTLLHELYHLYDNNASEQEVLKFEKLFIEPLWNAGYRKVDLE